MLRLFNITKKLPHIVFIHGANASSNSFNYIKNYCNITDYTDINYNSADGFSKNLTIIKEELQNKKDFYIISHSLGGIYAIYLQKELQVKGVISISTPFRGSRTADWAKMFVPMYKLFHDIGPRSDVIVDSLKINITCPWLQIVSTTGNVPWHGSKNDGVVTLKSMTHRKDIEYEYVSHNHYEVLVAKEVALLIENRLKQ